MDANKLKKLKEIGFELKRTCLTCKNFHKGQDAFGTCAEHSYFHLKHQETRELSVHSLGFCPEWEVSTFVDPVGSSWWEFYEFAP